MSGFATQSNNHEMKLFVWDFHGTLEHGNDGAVHEITNIVLENHRYSRRMTMDEAHMLSGKRWYEYFTYLLPDLEQDSTIQLQNACFSISQRHPEIISKHIKITPNAREVLEAIDKSHHSQLVLSNTRETSLEMFLHSINVAHYFPPNHRIAADSHTQKSKTKKEWLYEFLQDKTFPGGIVAIGDSLHDVELADCHPNGVGYLFSHPDRTHRAPTFPNKINDLSIILQEV